MTEQLPTNVPASPRAMPRWLKTLFVAGAALTAFLFIMVFAPSSRGYGGPAGWGNAFFYLLGALLLGSITLWGFLTWLIYRAQTRHSYTQRIGITVLFILLPPILLISNQGLSRLKGHAGATEFDSQSSAAVTLAGVAFPQGSQLEFVQDGDFGRTLIGATTRTPQMLGALQISSIRLSNPPDEHQLQLTLTTPTLIDGWLCNDGGHTEVWRNNGNITLKRCLLAGQTIDAVHWPAKTSVERIETGWSIYAASVIETENGDRICAKGIMVNGKSYMTVAAKYDADRQKLSLEDGELCDQATEN